MNGILHIFSCIIYHKTSLFSLKSPKNPVEVHFLQVFKLVRTGELPAEPDKLPSDSSNSDSDALKLKLLMFETLWHLSSVITQCKGSSCLHTIYIVKLGVLDWHETNVHKQL